MWALFLYCVGPIHWETNLREAIASLREVKGSLLGGVLFEMLTRVVPQGFFASKTEESQQLRLRKSAYARNIIHGYAKCLNCLRDHDCFQVLRLRTLLPVSFSSHWLYKENTRESPGMPQELTQFGFRKCPDQDPWFVRILVTGQGILYTKDPGQAILQQVPEKI